MFEKSADDGISNFSYLFLYLFLYLVMSGPF